MGTSAADADKKLEIRVPGVRRCRRYHVHFESARSSAMPHAPERGAAVA